VRDYDVVVDAVDNFDSRFLLNDACVLERRILVEGAILRFTGLAFTIKGGETACYRCLFPRPPQPGEAPTTAEAGVFGPVPGVIGAVQAAEAIKVLVGFGRLLCDRLLQVDLGDTTFTEVEIARDPACPVCGERPTITDLSGHEATAAGAETGAKEARQ
jgi:adenylyltransferase/sulfurtransferase